MKNRAEEIIHGTYDTAGERSRDILKHLGELSSSEERSAFFENVLLNLWTNVEMSDAERRMDHASAHVFTDANRSAVDLVLRPVIVSLDQKRPSVSDAAHELLGVIDSFSHVAGSQLYAMHKIITNDALVPYFSWPAVSMEEANEIFLHGLSSRDKEEIKAAFWTQYNPNLIARVLGILWPMIERAPDMKTKKAIFLGALMRAMFQAETKGEQEGIRMAEKLYTSWGAPAIKDMKPGRSQ
ncbi:MAG: hypothetical protein Q7R73_00910 [bacterium]|nr:hypothetical protein [bacterium]